MHIVPFVCLSLAFVSPARAQPAAASAPASDEAQGPAEEVVVLGKSFGIEAGTKTVAPLRKVPNSITVVDQQRIADQNIFSLNDLFVRTTGVASTGGDSEFGDFRARGFVIDNYLVDGVPNNGFAFEQPDVFVYDRVELLRGPAGLFSGSGSPAGSINLVRKRPLDTFAVSALAAAGSWNKYRASIDVSVPLSAAVKARAGIAYQDNDSFQDVLNENRTVAFANADFELGPTTGVTIGGHYDRFRGGLTSGLPALTNGKIPDFPRSTFGGLEGNRSYYSNKSAFAEVRQQLGGDWALRLSGQYGKGNRELNTAYVFSFTGLTPTDGRALLVAINSLRDREAVTADLNAIGSVSLFGRRHQIVVGGDYQWVDSLLGVSNRLQMGNVDLYARDYYATPYPNLPIISRSDTRVHQFGAYGQARLKLADPLILVLGGRLSWFEQRQQSVLPLRAATRIESNGRFTPYAGLVYDFAPRWTAYANFADTFTPQTGTTVAGDAPPPAVGKQYEVGIKGSPLGDRLLLSAAVFRIEQTGRTQTDVLNPGFVVTTGKVRSQGLELEANGRLAPGWTLNGGYAYTHVRYIDDVQKLGLANARQQPRHSVKLWTIYRPESGALERWSVGGGLSWQSRIFAENSRLGRFGRSIQNAYALADLRLGYQLTDRIELAGTVNNLFDKRYWERVNGIQVANSFGAPRNFLLTARARY